MTTFNGGNGEDTFVGGIDGDEANGAAGDDILFGLGGNDVLAGGSGSDTLDGGEGDDRLYSDAEPGQYQRPYFGNPYYIPMLDRSAEHDNLSGGAGNDRLSAGYGDGVDGGSGSDDWLMISFAGATSGVVADFRALDTAGTVTIGGGTIANVEGIEWLEGSDHGDLLAPNEIWANYAPIFGMGGDDTIIGAYYTGEVFGGDGNDIIDKSRSVYGFGTHGEAGDDTITASGNIDGGSGDDTITGTGWSTLRGGDGNDVITEVGAASSFGDGGNDIIYGNANASTIADGGDGDDVIYGAFPLQDESAPVFSYDSDNLKGGAGADVIYGGGGDDIVDGGSDDDLIFGGANNDTLSGGAGQDAIYGESGDDSAYGGDGDDLIASGAGIDQLSGEGGNDRIYFGADFGSGDLAAGGSGNDQLILRGDYSSGLSISQSNSFQIETLRLLSASDSSYGAGASAGPFSYSLTFADNLVPSGGAFSVDAAGLGASERLLLDASAETNGRLTVTAGAGDDDLTGGAGDDTFFLQRGGVDRAIGGGGSDGFFFGGALTTADVVDGGTGSDAVALQGNYAAGLTLTGIANVEFLSLLSGAKTQFGEQGTNRFSYSLTTTDANVVAGTMLTVQATGLLATENLTFNGAAETNGNFRVFAGQGEDVLTGGAGSDGFFFGADGNLAAADRIDGGGGTDSIALRGNYTLSLADATFTNVEVLAFLSGHTNEYGGALVPSGYDYDFTLANGNVAAGQVLDVNGAGLRSNESLRFDGRAETDGALRILSGAGDDSLFGGSGNDTLYGGLGKDSLQGGPGADSYQYRSAAESTSTGYDAITGFDWNVDRIDVPGATPRGFGQSAQGSLSTASFDADLAARMSGMLGAGEAALFTANAGTLAGHVFAVIDVNGQAGYQAGQDLVIELINSVLPIDPTAGVIV